MDESDHTDEWAQQGMNASEAELASLRNKIRTSQTILNPDAG